MKKFKVAIITKQDKVISGNFETKDEVDTFILSQDTKTYMVYDFDTDKIIEKGKL